MSRADVIVIGGGINGLTCAARLARKGRKVVLLERREILGGMAAAEEFHPGHVAPGLHHESAGFRPEVAEALGLAAHGLQRDPQPPPVFLPEEDGPGILLPHDPDAAAEIGRRSAADADAYREYRAFFARVAAFADRMFREPPPDPREPDFGKLLGTGLAFRRLGERGRLEVLRMGPMCVADWLNERFETPRLKAGLAFPAIQGSFLGPWSPGTQTNLMLHEANRCGAVRGGAAAIVAALESAARAAGVEIRIGCDVASIDTSADGVAGVTLATGETVEARRVAASCDPKTTFLRLLSPRDIPAKVGERARAYRAAGTTAKVHLALKERLRFPGGPDAAVTRATTGATLDDLERAFDAAKYGEFSARPVLDILVPDSPSPAVSIVAHFAPRGLRAGWSEDTRERLGDAVVAELERWVPGVAADVVAREVLTPADIEARYGAAGGHIHHGEHGIDQLAVRPFPECARYATPVAGLFLCGAGSYPGGGVTGAPGFLAAEAVQRG